MAESTKQINESENAKLFRTRMDIFVLNALNEKEGQGYGYDVISYIQEHTKGHYKIKSISTIYNILKRLEAAGYVSTVEGDNESYGAARVYYALTPAGKEYLEQDKKEWKYIRTLLDNLVSDEEFDLDNDEPPYSASLLKPLTKRSREGSEMPAQEQPVSENVVSSIEDAPAEEDHSVATPDDDIPFYNYSDEAQSVTEAKEPTDQYKDAPEKSFGEAVAAKYFAAASDYRRATEQETPSFAEPEQNVKEDEFATAEEPVKEPVLRPEFRPVTSERTVVDSAESIKRVDFAPKDTYSVNRINEEDSPLSPYIENLKKSLLGDGYALHTFNTAKKPNTVRYFFSNRIMRDMSIGSFLYLVVTLLLTNLLKDLFGVSLTAIHSIAAVGFVFVAVAFVAYLRNPKGKKKDAVNLKLLNSVLILVFTVCYMAVAVYYLFTSKYSFYSSQMYAPAIILSTIPFSGLMYTVLYRSGKYYQK